MARNCHSVTSQVTYKQPTYVGVISTDDLIVSGFMPEDRNPLPEMDRSTWEKDMPAFLIRRNDISND